MLNELVIQVMKDTIAVTAAVYGVLYPEQHDRFTAWRQEQTEKNGDCTLLEVHNYIAAEFNLPPIPADMPENTDAKPYFRKLTLAMLSQALEIPTPTSCRH